MGKTATLTGKLSLTQNATITEGASVLTGDKQVTELKQFTGTITVKKVPLHNVSADLSAEIPATFRGTQIFAFLKNS